MTNLLKKFSGLLFVASIMAACQGEQIVDDMRTVQATGYVEDTNIEDLEIAPMYLAGLGERVCKLSYSYVKKDASGNFSKIVDHEVSDNITRSGFGRGCLNWCVSAFDQLKTANAGKRNILIKNCKFTGNKDIVANVSTTSPAPDVLDKAKPEFKEAKMAAIGVCKVIGGAGNLISKLKDVDKPTCKTECKSKNATNPERRCEFKGEIFRAHPKKYCEVRGLSGKLHFDANLKRFDCRASCKEWVKGKGKAKAQCKWGNEILRAHPEPKKY